MHRLSQDGLDHAETLAEAFSDCLDKVDDTLTCFPTPRSVEDMQEASRCYALARTKLQEASFFAKRALAIRASR